MCLQFVFVSTLSCRCIARRKGVKNNVRLVSERGEDVKMEVPLFLCIFLVRIISYTEEEVSVMACLFLDDGYAKIKP